MKIPNIHVLYFLIAFVVGQSSVSAQRATATIQKESDVNFTELANQELNTALRRIEKDAEEDENTKQPYEPHKDKKVGIRSGFQQIQLRSNSSNASILTSPKPTATYAGSLDNGWIPPDVNGVVGSNHLLTTLNGTVHIQNKNTGSLVSTVSLNSFFSGLYESYVFDPRVLYDTEANRYIIIGCTDAWSSSSSLVIAISQTDDPSGLWYRYSLKSDVYNDNVWLDYPALGFNKNWIVVTGNMFTYGGYFGYSQIYTFNKANLYAGQPNNIYVFKDAEPFTLQPCATYDNNEPNLYMITDWTGNDNGKGALKIYKLSPDTEGSPQYASVGLSVVNNTWRWSGSTAPQKGDERRIATNDSRLLNAIFKNGFIWTTHTVFLPELAPTRTGIDWFQIKPNTDIVQYGRIEDPTSTIFYAYPSIAVNNCNDVMIGFNQFSATTYASAAYAYRSNTDPLSTMRSSYVYKEGLAPYYKTFGTSRNRWGDYSATCVDPIDGNTFWTLQEYANTPRDRWATHWAKLQGKSLSVNLKEYIFPATAASTNLIITANSTWTSQNDAIWLTKTPASGTTNATMRLTCPANATGNTRQTKLTITNGCLTQDVNIIQKATCDKPSGLQVSNRTDNSLILSWKSAGNVTDYKIEWKRSTDIEWLSKTVSALTTTLEKLTQNAIYQIKVTALCPFGDTNMSVISSFSTLPSACLATPLPVVSDIKTSTAIVSWRGSDNALSYQIIYRKVGTASWTNVAVASTLSNRVLTALASNTNYEVAIIKVCINNPRLLSDTSAIAVFKTLVLCRTPTGLMAQNTRFNATTLKWSSVPSPISYYKLEYKKLNDAQWTILTTTQNSLNLENLIPNTTYQARITAVCTTEPLSESPVSVVLNFRTLSYVCGAPVTPSVSDLLPNSCLISWRAATNANRYRLEYKKSTETIWQKVYEGQNLTYNLTNLAERTTYNLRLITICNAPPEVNSTMSMLNVTTPARNCTDIHESNNTRTTARTLTLNNLIRAKIGTATDEDWFRVTTTTLGNLEIALRDLSADYHLYLYDATGNILASSIQNGTTDETIVISTPSVSTVFFIQVKSTTGAFHSDCYALKASFTPNTPSLYLRSREESSIPDLPAYYMTLSPNPTTGIVRIEIGSPEVNTAQLTVTDYLGRVVFENRALVLDRGVQTQEVNLSGLSNGVYMIKLTNRDFITMRKVLLNK